MTVGKPNKASDDAIARWFERWLEKQHPGTTWHVVPRESGPVPPSDAHPASHPVERAT